MWTVGAHGARDVSKRIATKPKIVQHRNVDRKLRQDVKSFAIRYTMSVRGDQVVKGVLKKVIFLRV